MTDLGHQRPPALAGLRADPEMAALRRSLTYYYGDAGRAAAADRLYQRFLRPGDVVFDIGAHVGHRVGSFRRLGARVVAVEPQPLCARALRTLYAGDRRVKVIQAACGARSGILPLRVNSGNPTVSTLSPEFVTAATGAAGWERETWDDTVMVRVVTLDDLIDRFGVPAFVKIDVEGYEDEVLAGLSEPVPALSFEHTTIAREVGRRSLDRLDRLGYDGFDVSPAETMELTFGSWVPRARLLRHLLELPHEANSGDVYAVCSMRALTRQ